MSWLFFTVYKELESEYDFKTRRLLLLHPLSNNLVLFNKSKVLIAHVPRTSAGVLYNLAIVQAICDK
jgi:hypothetical protein